jgi:hypothetical protein
MRQIVVQVRFEAENPDLEPIEDKMYVGSGRFIVEENQPIIVEYKISEVAAACDVDLGGAGSSDEE